MISGVSKYRPMGLVNSFWVRAAVENQAPIRPKRVRPYKESGSESRSLQSPMPRSTTTSRNSIVVLAAISFGNVRILQRTPIRLRTYILIETD